MNSLCCRCPGVPRKTVRVDLVADVSKYLSVFFSRFGETESIAAIVMMMWKYRVEVKQEPEHAGETREQCFARITSSQQYMSQTYAMSSPSYLLRAELSFSPDRVPLVFKRRWLFTWILTFGPLLHRNLFYYLLIVSCESWSPRLTYSKGITLNSGK